MNPAKLLALALACCALSTRAKDEPLLSIGAARLDITPTEPIRLHGYGGRTTNATGAAQPIFAKALAFGTDREGASILLTVDNLGVPGTVTDEVAARLKKRARISREQIALCSSHTHSAPVLSGVAPNIFSADIIPEQQAAIDRYTRQLVDNLERVALAALSNRAPAKLAWSEGTVTFAKNRRVTRGNRTYFGDNNDGPVDHALPVLMVRDARDQVRAVLVNYACHCTTLGGEWNQIHGDWSGCAQEAMERDHPGAIALISIGCGADANPFPRGQLELARAHGEEIAAEVRRLLTLPGTPLTRLPSGKIKRFNLDFDTLPTRDQWADRAARPGIVGYHARKNLARLDRGEKLPTKLPYVSQSWVFGDQLAMVFLAGEVVIDYQRRLKREFDSSRLWVNSYANDVPCYIPSRRILEEGGYEAEDSLWYYDRPARLAPRNEDRIIESVHDLLPKRFKAPPQRGEMTAPLSPAQALNSLRVAPEFRVELAAAEPLITSPVALDWGADGKLWVVEMRDYPMGLDGQWKPGGAVRFLTDTNQDGRYDTSTVFLDGLPFPTGVFAWRRGALICAAPDILYAEDSNGDGRADVVRKVFTGFATNNFQARVNGLSLGLDNWIHGANGLLGGQIRFGEGTGFPSPVLQPPTLRGTLDIRGRDFRMNPDTGAFEPTSGLSQQSRVRDDWGNWFGCDNSHQLWHYPLDDDYARRNPHVATPAAAVQVPRGAEWNRLFPASRTLERFNNPESANRITSGCGLEIYRDDWLGPDYQGNAFTCEPVHNLVHREVLTTDGATFRSARAGNESSREFMTSSDSWFRPVQARTGPDGALWIVDMYRFVIEHPRWIPSNRLARLDVRAGANQGRIYRVVRRDASPRSVLDLTQLPDSALAGRLETPNGTERDRVHRELLQRADRSAGNTLRSLAQSSPRASVRLQALAALAAVGELDAATLSGRMNVETNPAVKIHLLRWLETRGLSDAPLLASAKDPDERLRFQAALSAGALEHPESALSSLIVEATTNLWLRAAVLSSANKAAAGLLPQAIQEAEASGNFALADGLLATAMATAPPTEIARSYARLIPSRPEEATAWRFGALASLGGKFPSGSRPAETREETRQATELARRLVAQPKTGTKTRQAALRFLAGELEESSPEFWRGLLSQAEAQASTLEALWSSPQPQVADWVLAAWARFPIQMRPNLIERLTSRAAWADRLLTALERLEVAPAEVSVPARSRLLTLPSPEQRARAERLWPKRTTNRAQLVAEYRRGLRDSGQPAAGAELFRELCAGCHPRHGGAALAVGPDLGPLRDKSAEDFLVAILDPNAVVEPRFINYLVETKDGDSFNGIIRSETATSLELVAPGRRETFLRSDLRRLEASSLSLMPEGLEQGLTPVQMNDLIAYLKQAPPRPFGLATPAEHAEARRKWDQLVPKGFGKILSAAERLEYSSWLGRWPLAHCRQTDGNSRVSWESVPAEIAKGRARFFLPVGLGFISAPGGKFTLQVGGQPLLDFDVGLEDQVWTSQDGQARLLYTVREANAQDSCGVMTLELPADRIPPGQAMRFAVAGSAANSQRWFGIYEVGPARP